MVIFGVRFMIKLMLGMALFTVIVVSSLFYVIKGVGPKMKDVMCPMGSCFEQSAVSKRHQQKGIALRQSGRFTKFRR